MIRPGRSEAGQSIIIIAVAFTGMIAMLALVLDLGYAFVQRREMQNGADAAALAGGRALNQRADNTAASELAIARQVNFYAEQNGVPDSNGAPGDGVNANVHAYFVDSGNSVVGNQIGANNGVPATAVSVLVEGQQQHSTFFAPVLGIPVLTTRAVAQSGFQAAGAMGGLRPMAFSDAVFPLVYGDEYTLWDDEKTETGHYIANGNRGWVYLDGNNGGGASDLKEWMQNGYPGIVRIGDVLPGKPGVTNSATKEAVVGEVYLVPIYDGDATVFYKVVGFGAFKVTAVKSTGNPKYIKGSFKELITTAVGGGTQYFGVGALRLAPPAAVPGS